MKNIYYFKGLQELGGTEQFLYEIAKKYKDYDITVLYDTAHPTQVNRISKFVRCKQRIKGEKLVCDRAFFNFNIDCIDDIESTENYYAFVAHANFCLYGYQSPIDHPKLNHFFGVSKFACEKLEEYAEIMGLNIKAELIYNPLTLEPQKKVIKFVCASRLADKVKGGERTRKLIEALDRYCIANNEHYFMLVFADSYQCDSNNVKVMNPTLDVRQYIANADVLVQLSDDMETYGYSINEALGYSKRVICTPLSVLKELPIPNGATLICEWDMSNVDEVIDEIFKNKDFTFKYNPPISRWNEVLKPGKSTYQEEIKNMVNVKCIVQFHDIDGKVTRKPGDEFYVTEQRANDLMDSTKPGGALVVMVKEENNNKKQVAEDTKKEVVEEPKEEKAEKTTQKKKTTTKKK